ncbi:MAG: crossover junction endodeoxyribonuclease RuvC [bacterium]|nr:crossover junction endodeoxyribonuclease RuvC [bacterium]
MPNSDIFIGIDPGTAITGYGAIRVSKKSSLPEVLEYGVIRTASRLPDSTRLSEIYNALSELLIKYKPIAVGCEKIFFSKNIKTASAVSHARGVILLAIDQHGAKLVELTPPQVKNAITGYGSADKKQVQYMTQQILQLKSIPKPDDAADALAIAITTSSLMNNPAEI